MLVAAGSDPPQNWSLNLLQAATATRIELQRYRIRSERALPCRPRRILDTAQEGRPSHREGWLRVAKRWSGRKSEK